MNINANPQAQQQQQPQEGNFEVMQPSAIEALERAQVDVQISTAHAYPRSLSQFHKRALSMATLDLETAESCIYARPVGDGKTAEGASIRMAEIVAAAYGNIRVAAQIVEQTERYVKAEGVAHDLESNYAAKSQCMEPTVKRNGQPYSEGQRAVVAKAALAKAFRDAVFKVVPRALCKTVIDAAKSVINKQSATIEQRRERVRSWLKGLKVDDARVMTVLGAKGWADVTDDHLMKLTGLKTALNEQDITLEEAFPFINPTTNSPVTSQPASKPAEQKPAAAAPTPAPAASPAQSAPSTPPETAPTQPAAASAAGDPVKEPTKPVETPQSEAPPAEQHPETPPTPPTAAPEPEADPLAALLALTVRDGVTEGQVQKYCQRMRLCRSTQKLSELASAKLTQIVRNWNVALPEIKKEQP